MPAYQQPADKWLPQLLSEIRRDLAALKATRTQYVVDPAGVCQAIVGHLNVDHRGVATGLGDVWGIASFKTGSWVRL